MVHKPYHESYYQRRNKRLLAVLSVAAAVLVTALFILSRSGRSHGDEYIGKIVKISGSVSDIGQVVRYTPKRVIVIKPLATRFNTTVYYQLAGPCTLTVLADNPETFFRKFRFAFPEKRPASGGEAAAEEESEPSIAGATEEEPVPGESEGKSAAEESGNAPSPSRHDQALAQFSAALEALERRAAALDERYISEVMDCLGDNRTAFETDDFAGRRWFGLIDQAMNLVELGSPECRVILESFARELTSFRAAMEQAKKQARLMGLYPGEERDIRRRFRLDWAGWD